MLPPTPINQAIAQTVNTSYNFAVNIANSTSSNPMSTQDIAVSWGASCAAAVFISVGFRKYLLTIKSTSTLMKGALALTPLMGVISANTVNFFFSRYKDILNGIAVVDPESPVSENLPGLKSKAVGQMAFTQCLITRWLLSVPCLLGPPL